MDCASESIVVAILAGGDGTRIGGGKALRELAGKSLVGHALSMAARWSDDVVLVVRDPAQVEGTTAPLLRDAPGAEGPIAGVAAALRYAVDAGHGAVLTIPCDTPFLPPDLALRLREGLGERAGAAIPSSGGILHPACALWRGRAFFLLGSYLAAGRRSLRGFADYIGAAIVEWPDAPDDPFLNVNTGEDLAAAEARWTGATQERSRST